ncbi:hypothetical protein GQX74_011744 [Glossina fuscipes]|nr:hypothetical protein GQX74_011744 [Glossina fuscipes]
MNSLTYVAYISTESLSTCSQHKCGTTTVEASSVSPINTPALTRKLASANVRYDGSMHTETNDEPQKKKYAKEAWPGRKPINILVDCPSDQSSRWSAHTNNPPQYLTIKKPEEKKLCKFT